MRIGAIPESLLERVAMWLGLVPTPIIDTFHAVIVARAAMVATKLGVFDALAKRPLAVGELAGQLGVDAAALGKLLNVLIATGYLRHGGQGFENTRLSGKWLTSDGPQSIRDNMLLRFLEWQAVEKTEEFIRSGEALDVHRLLQGEQWDVYQRGMRALARLSAPEVVSQVPRLSEPRTMLDIGGGHGTYSVAFCRRYPQLKATILDLAETVASAKPLLAEEQVDGRAVHRIGNANTEDLGRSAWDIVLISHLIHHLSDAENAALVGRVAEGLRPGGVLLILDVLRAPSGEAGSQTGALLDLYFSITSRSGTYSAGEIAGWLNAAGLASERTIALRTAPGVSVVVARKPA